MRNYISPEKNLLIPLEKSRSEFIEKFNERNRTFTKQSTSSSRNQNERWNLLYNQGKVQKLKEETYRKSCNFIRMRFKLFYKLNSNIFFFPKFDYSIC